MVRPRAFQKGKRYPVVVSVYGGPSALTVRADERAYLLAQWMADHGVVVVSIDNRGTPRRDRAWSRAIKGDFGQVPLDDQVAALQALGARLPELDLSRVGIYGWSFGGYMSALAVMRRPDVFKVAVAGAPVVDWRDYDTHYTERYLDLPQANPKGYEASNLLTYAGKLDRPLLLIHGTDRRQRLLLPQPEAGRRPVPRRPPLRVPAPHRHPPGARPGGARAAVEPDRGVPAAGVTTVGGDPDSRPLSGREL